MERIVCLVCLIFGYLCGLIQSAYILGKIKHVDVRRKGSGNLGTTNMFRVLGIRAGIMTFVGDIGKVVLAVVIVYFVVLKGMYMDIDRLALYFYTGFGVVLGHDFPCYLEFKGGKGVAASAAVLVSLGNWQLILVGLISFFGVAIITQYVSLGSLSLMTFTFIAFIIFTQFGIINVDSRWLIDCYVIDFLMSALVFFQHRKNIYRLLHGTENKFRFRSSKEIKEEEEKEKAAEK